MRTAVLPLLGSTILAIAATATLAADLPSRRSPPMYLPPPVPLFTWTGFYAGVNAGVAFDPKRGGQYAFSNDGGPNTINGSGGTDGVLALGGSHKVGVATGGQIGYNRQFDKIVAGIEADAQYLGPLDGTTNYAFTPTTPLTTGSAFVPIPGLAKPEIYVGHRTDFFGTVRGRLGYAFDRALLYGTGGLAYSPRAVGYAVGGGVEYAVSQNISIRGEYLYVNLDRSGGGFAAVFDAASNTLELNARGGADSFSVARIALNYKFDVLPPAVVARY